jgi:hypothetical protein
MKSQTNTENQHEQSTFKLEFIAPYSTFQGGKPAATPYVIDGLLPQGAFSALGAKPKQGKSSLSRYEAVCVAKGAPFLGRSTVRGEVILISLEDPRNHVDNCLKVLGYDLASDARIHIVEKLAPTIEETIDVLGEELQKMSDVRLIIVDTLPKLIRVKDLNDYMPVLAAVEQLRSLARKFPQLHIQGLAHCKKVKTDDPFDSLLGSTALRGEPDTNIAIYRESGQHIITAETRIGKNIPPTILNAELMESEGADVVKEFYLGDPFNEWKTEKTEKSEKKQKIDYEERVIEYLRSCEDNSAPQEQVLKEVGGKRKRSFDSIKRLTDESVLTITGVRHSPTNPLTLTLNVDTLGVYYANRGRSPLQDLFPALASDDNGGQIQ